MPENTSSFLEVRVNLPIAVVKKVDALAKALEFPSRSALVLRSVEFYLSRYYPKGGVNDGRR